MPEIDLIGDRKNEFILDCTTFLDFLRGKYGTAENKDNYALIMSAVVDTEHEIIEKRFQMLSLLSGNRAMQTKCGEGLLYKEQFMLLLAENL